ncbi:MAG: hypothetical protein KGI06_04960 [Candidatus Micrarchaeota archaeon]|nr:hypothetical protein [Candidatus Micrarchaeota archaeon]
MKEGKALISNNGKGNIRLEYGNGIERRIKLWEARKDAALETTFDGNGYVLNQVLIKPDADTIKQRVALALSEAGIKETDETEYSEVRINKPCPKCGQFRLSRYVEAFSSRKDVPVMPIYHCGNCASKSYYLTKDYLEHLVLENRSLFSESEISELEGDKQAVMGELEGYIIRIFASKQIMCIK